MGLLDLASPASTVEPGEWLRDQVHGFGQSVESVVPAGFPSYVRVFHPASRKGRPVRWSAVAKANGRTSHRLMQWPCIVGSWQLVHGDNQPEIWDVEPAEGSLPPGVAARLVDLLRPQTTTPDDCYFAVWEGFGALPEDVRRAPTFDLPYRRYHLFSGPIETALESAEPSPFTQSPNLWWPADRAWCVATEIDFMTTYVGCSRPCAGDILADTELEVAQMQPEDGVAWASDTVNDLPTQG